MNYGGGFGYYGGDPDEYEQDDEDFEPQPQQRRNAPRSPGLRAHMKAITAENRQLKKELEEQKAALAELMEGETLQPSQGAYPNSRLTQEEQLQIQRMQEQGVVGVAAPAGTQAEQIRQIRNAETPDALMAYLRSQGNSAGTQSYNGMGY
ncbi:hypothetical protein [Streptomyces sp. MAI_2237]